MKLRVATLLAASLCLGLSTSGCIIHQKKPHGHRNQAVKSKKGRNCHPSQYWDGHKCRHKGKGKGARKHDD